MRDGRADVAAGIEIDSLQSKTFDRLRFDVLDAVHGGRVGALGDEHDAPFHVDRREAWIVVDQHHDRQIDCGKNVDVHHGEGERTKNQHQQRHDRDRERSTES